MPSKMTLTRFRVTNFRSVEDSGWIDINDVTALIGTNESGKSNLLLPLWKLNPAKGGAINPTSDYPRKHFGTFRNAAVKPVFIESEFEVHDELRELLADKTEFAPDMYGIVIVRRRFDSQYEIDFPEASLNRSVSRENLLDLLNSTEVEIKGISPLEAEQDLKVAILDLINSAIRILPKTTEFEFEVVLEVHNIIQRVGLEDAPKTSSIVPRFQRLQEEITRLHTNTAKPHPRDLPEIKMLIIENLPRFVYYSNYGNLDSEIYLPHVIANLRREDIGEKERAKARTLKVLFEFVKLEPDEILTLGREVRQPDQPATSAQIDKVAQHKKERSILLQSASTLLTNEFRHWWKQGDYRFRFEADGDHFRIWVADDRRPEEVELEGRSTGLQWFLSFYLVFLVESKDSHTNCILLLDEPGLSLHPVAQRDLSDFFDGLAQENRIIYTTHSPFLVDADRLDRVRKVYVAPDGTSKATSDLGAGGIPNTQSAGYAVHAALGLNIAESLLLGCEPIVVEGPSDQHYLTAIKTLLIRNGSIKIGRELVFPPAGGAKGIQAIASVLGGRNGELPFALLDSDEQGRKFAESLRKSLYADVPHRIHDVGAFVKVSRAEVEDLIPVEVMIKAAQRQFRELETELSDIHVVGEPIAPQIEKWAKQGGSNLLKGWKVDLAKRVKQMLLDGAKIPNETLDIWKSLFESFQSTLK